jgi:hypothetical protein
MELLCNMTGRASKKYANVWKTQFGGSKMHAILQDVQLNKRANKLGKLQEES